MKPFAIAWPRLALLGAAVLATHLWLLGMTGRPASPTVPSSRSPAFVTRSVSVPAAASRRAAPGPGRFAMPLGQQPSTPPTKDAAPPSAPPEPGAPAQPMLAFAVPASARLHYQVSATSRGERREGRGELAWRHDGENYEASLEIAGAALRSRRQRSIGRITSEGLAPLRFSDKSRSEEAAHFQREPGKVSFSSNRPEAELAAGAQDHLSVLVQLGAMVGGDPARFPPGSSVAIQIAGTRDAEPGLFVVQGEEELLLPGGAVKALKLTRNPRKEYDQSVELWLAPTMDYVPVRLRLTQPNGDSVDHQWSSTDRD